ncbi:hypothetical protein B0H11DRAFT_1944690 [Mycena galericulata]|nr:hypothetical protein B0H11DRAFT_1944690 [Mycena galericulata]
MWVTHLFRVIRVNNLLGLHSEMVEVDLDSFVSRINELLAERALIVEWYKEMGECFEIQKACNNCSKYKGATNRSPCELTPIGVACTICRRRKVECDYKQTYLFQRTRTEFFSSLKEFKNAYSTAVRRHKSKGQLKAEDGETEASLEGPQTLPPQYTNEASAPEALGREDLINVVYLQREKIGKYQAAMQRALAPGGGSDQLSPTVGQGKSSLTLDWVYMLKAGLHSMPDDELSLDAKARIDMAVSGFEQVMATRIVQWIQHTIGKRRTRSGERRIPEREVRCDPAASGNNFEVVLNRDDVFQWEYQVWGISSPVKRKDYMYGTHIPRHDRYEKTQPRTEAMDPLGCPSR